MFKGGNKITGGHQIREILNCSLLSSVLMDETTISFRFEFSEGKLKPKRATQQASARMKG